MKRSTATGGPAALSSGATVTVAIRMTTTMRGIVTPEAVVLDLETASIASRGLARTLDPAIQGVLMLVRVLVAGGLFGVSGTLADRKSARLNSSHSCANHMTSSS